MKNLLTAAILLLLAGAILLAGCAQPQTYPATPTPAPTTAAPVTPAPTPIPDTIRVTSNPRYGQILTDMDGITLYYFARDTPFGGTSVCTGTCATTWPPFDTAQVQVSSPLNAADFVEFTRGDGRPQVMYMGWPLYYYSGDKAPGDTNGYGIGRLWYVTGVGGVVTLAPTTTVPTTPPAPISYGGGGY